MKSAKGFALPKKVLSLLPLLVLLVYAVNCPLSASAQAPAPSTTPVAAPGIPVVGTFDKTSIVLAFYRSPYWAAILADRRFELNAIQAAHDTVRAKDLEKYGAESQDRAMQQLAGKAPIDNILTVLQTEFKELENRMKLSAIVDSSAADPKAATVDVTFLLMD
ncbi:MAG: hypothetical protein ABR991_03460 [Terracidiphilus sp.]